MRIVLSLLVLSAGVLLGLVSYFFLAAPLGTPTDEGFANPRVPYAATIFVGAVVVVFLAPLIYELLPDRRSD